MDGRRRPNLRCPDWKSPTAGKMFAVLLDFDGGHIIEISAEQPGPDVLALVGDPMVDRMNFVPELDFWVPDSGMSTSRFNPGATGFLLQLMQDAVSGEFVVDDTTREHIRDLLGDTRWKPAVFGRCLITGVNEAGDDPGPLSEGFQRWLTRQVSDEPLSGSAPDVDVALAIAQALGVELDSRPIVVARQDPRPDWSSEEDGG